MKKLGQESKQEDQQEECVVIETSEIFDKAQKEAFEFALKNKFAIIQGPPGCGKTFLGLKLLKTLLDKDPKSPILVMTYKKSCSG